MVVKKPRSDPRKYTWAMSPIDNAYSWRSIARRASEQLPTTPNPEGQAKTLRRQFVSERSI